MILQPHHLCRLEEILVMQTDTVPQTKAGLLFMKVKDSFLTFVLLINFVCCCCWLVGVVHYVQWMLLGKVIVLYRDVNYPLWEELTVGAVP